MKKKPLFPDLDKGLYLAEEYATSNIPMLRYLGICTLSWADMLDRIEADIAKGSRSQVQTRTTTDLWHTTFASSLLTLLQQQSSSSGQLRNRAKRLRIIPLSPSTWVASADKDIYFPRTDHVLIPVGLGLRLVEDTAASMPSRVDLFTALDVRHHDRSQICALILASSKLPRMISTSGAITRLRYLFYFWPEQKYMGDGVYVPTEGGISRQLEYSINQQLYFHSDNRYSTQQLLGDLGYQLAFFLSKDLEAAVLPEERSFKRSWREWLGTTTGAREYPELCDNSNPEVLSPTMLGIIKNNSPGFLGVLEKYWKTEYQALVVKRPALKQALSTSSVLCESAEKAKLQNTYLPLPVLKDEARRFNAVEEFPFLKLPVELDEENQLNYSFLKYLDIGCDLDILFYIEVLRTMKDSIVDIQMDLVCELYGLIYRKLSTRLGSTFTVID